MVRVVAVVGVQAGQTGLGVEPLHHVGGLGRDTRRSNNRLESGINMVVIINRTDLVVLIIIIFILSCIVFFHGTQEVVGQRSLRMGDQVLK